MSARSNLDSLLEGYLDDGLTEFPDHAFDAVRRDIHRTRQRVVIGPWREPIMSKPVRLGLVAVVLVIAAGVAWSQLAPRSGVGPGPTPVPTVLPSPQNMSQFTQEVMPLQPGAYLIEYAMAPGGTGTGPTITFDVPAAGWTSFANFAVDRPYDDGASVGPSFVVWRITNVYKDPCTDHIPRDVAPGPGVDELLQALAGQTGIDASPITDVTIDGYAGKSVALTIAADIDACEGGFFTWGSQNEGRFAQARGEVDTVYALDVNGVRVTFFTRVMKDTAPAHAAELKRIVESIDIQP